MVSDPGDRDASRRCSYHQDHEYFRKDYKMLKKYMEEFVQTEHFKEYINASKQK